jgi:hypothetical protein
MAKKPRDHNREPGNKSMGLQPAELDKGMKSTKGKGQSFQGEQGEGELWGDESNYYLNMNSAGNWISYAKDKTRSLSLSHTIMNSQWIEGLNITCEIETLLEENIQ